MLLTGMLGANVYWTGKVTGSAELSIIMLE